MSHTVPHCEMTPFDPFSPPPTADPVPDFWFPPIDLADICLMEHPAGRLSYLQEPLEDLAGGARETCARLAQSMNTPPYQPSAQDALLLAAGLPDLLADWGVDESPIAIAPAALALGGAMMLATPAMPAAGTELALLPARPSTQREFYDASPSMPSETEVVVLACALLLSRLYPSRRSSHSIDRVVRGLELGLG